MGGSSCWRGLSAAGGVLLLVSLFVQRTTAEKQCGFAERKAAAAGAKPRPAGPLCTLGTIRTEGRRRRLQLYCNSNAAGAVTAVPAESLPFQDTSTVPLFTETHPGILAEENLRARWKANAGGRRQTLQRLGEPESGRALLLLHSSALASRHFFRSLQTELHYERMRVLRRLRVGGWAGASQWLFAVSLARSPLCSLASSLVRVCVRFVLSDEQVLSGLNAARESL